MAEFADFFTRIIDILNESGIQDVIVGGVAAIIKGKMRTTADLDLILENDGNKIKKIIEQLRENNFEISEEQFQYGIEEGFQIPIFDEKSSMRIDLKIAASKQDQDALNERQIENYLGEQVYLPSLEQILFGKIWFLGDVEDETDENLLEYNDTLDFIAIFQLFQSEIDIDRLRNKTQKVDLEKTLDRLLNLQQKNHFES